MHAGAAVQEPVDVEQPCLDEECDDVMLEFAMWTEEMDRMLGRERIEAVHLILQWMTMMETTWIDTIGWMR